MAEGYKLSAELFGRLIPLNTVTMGSLGRHDERPPQERFLIADSEPYRLGGCSATASAAGG